MSIPDENTIAIRVASYKKGAFEFQKRRHEEWRENYSLYRDNIITNRLTQRQSVNVPLMKETIKTLIAKTDEFPEVYFESVEGDKQKEVFMNEYWRWTRNEDNLEIKDIVDKKQVGLYGITAMKLNIRDQRFSTEVLEPFDVLIDRYADPSDIDNTANYMCHQNIFRTLSQLSANPFYDQTAVGRLKTFYAESKGLVRSEENYEQMQAKNQRLQDLGVWDTENPEVGETVVDLVEHYIKLWDEEEKRFKIYVRVTALQETLLMKPLEEIMGVNFFPLVIWSEDVEKTDLYPDGIGDIVRTPNKVLNAWFSQLTENRTLRNYGMNYYDATGKDSFVPQSFTPTPWGWYPINGNPNDKIKRVEVPELSESIDEMNFVIGMVERATASTKTEKGVESKSGTTLGEIQLISANANERITSVAKFYRRARLQLGEKFYKIVDANADKLKAVKVHKKSIKGKLYSHNLTPSDWKSELGYVCKVVSSGEREQKTIEQVQKFQAIKTEFPNNVPLQLTMKKKMLDLVEMSPEEIEAIMNFEKQLLGEGGEAPAPAPNQPQPANLPAPTPAPVPALAR